MQMVTASQWPSFFSRLAGFHRGQPVSVEPEGRVTLHDGVLPTAPLLDVAFSHANGRAVVSVITGTAEAPRTTSIQDVNLVWAIHDMAERLIAVEIIRKGGGNVILSLGDE
jgi:hypothetical protein